MDIQTEKGLKDALSFIEAGNFIQAQKIILAAFEYSLESSELVFTSDCCNRWIAPINSLSELNDYSEKGESLLVEWKNFLYYLKSQKNIYQPAYYAVCRGIFSLALQNFSHLLNEKSPVQKADILRKTGLCYKKLGEFENAKNCLSEANSLHGSQAAVMADLADCYALCGNDKAAKVLFREAFFIDYKSIDLEFLDSELIKCLIEKTENIGYSGEELKAWIPVYGVLWGVFTIRRTMRSQEVGKLKQEIYAMENENKDPSRSSPMLIPRLIYKYFWLIDYCQSINDSQLINEVLLKIKILDTNVYNQYVK
ncbi:MAG: hypothetical protein K6F15_07935 [Treponema sp.]|nr:hypothetical protein [Treponema sp.]